MTNTNNFDDILIIIVLMTNADYFDDKYKLFWWQIEITKNNDKYLCEVKTQYGTGYLAVCQGKCLLLLREACCGVTVHCLKPNYASTSAFSRFLLAFWQCHNSSFSWVLSRLCVQVLSEIVFMCPNYFSFHLGWTIYLVSIFTFQFCIF